MLLKVVFKPMLAKKTGIYGMIGGQVGEAAVDGLDAAGDNGYAVAVGGAASA